MKRIIVADDDPGIQDVMEIILRRAGYEPVIYSSADPILNSRFDEPDIFLIDRQLQDADGLNICRFLKQRGTSGNTPVIIFSASGSVKELAKDAGADAFLEKPFNTKILLEMIEELTR